MLMFLNCFLNVSVFDNRRKWMKNIRKTYHGNVNLNLMIEYVIQIKNGMKNCVDVSAKIKKNIMRAKNVIFGILLFIFGILEYLGSITGDLVNMCDEVNDVVRPMTLPTGATSYSKVTKTIPMQSQTLPTKTSLSKTALTNFNEKMQPIK